MKAPGKKPTIEQWDWINIMRSHGYKAEYYDDWQKAQEAIIVYLQGGSYHDQFTVK